MEGGEGGGEVEWCDLPPPVPSYCAPTFPVFPGAQGCWTDKGADDSLF